MFLAALLYGVPSIGQAAPGNGLAQRVADLEVEIAALQALFSVDEDGNLTIAPGGDLVLDAGIGREVVVEKKAMMMDDATVMGETMMMDDATVMGATKLEGSATVMGSAMMMDDATVMGATEFEGSTMMMQGATVDGGQVDAIQDITVGGFLNLPAAGIAEARLYAIVEEFTSATPEVIHEWLPHVFLETQ